MSSPIPPPGFYWAKCDVNGADDWTVVEVTHTYDFHGQPVPHIACLDYEGGCSVTEWGPRLEPPAAAEWQPNPHPLTAKLSFADTLGNTLTARGLERVIGEALGWRPGWTPEALIDRIKDLMADEAAGEAER